MRVGVLSALLAATGLLVLALPGPHPEAGPPLEMVEVPWWALAVLFAVAELSVFRIRVRHEEQSVSISELPLVVGLFCLAPPMLLLARVLGSAAVFVFYRRTTPLKTSFNLALVTAGTAVAAAVFHLVGGGADATAPRGWLAAVLAAATCGLLDGVALTLVIGWYDGWPPARVVAGQLGQALGLPAVFALGGVVAALALYLGRPAVVPLVLGGAAILGGYRAYAALLDRHAGVQRLYGLSDALRGAQDVDEVARAVVRHAVVLLHGRSAELLVERDGQPGVRRWAAVAGRDAIEAGPAGAADAEAAFARAVDDPAGRLDAPELVLDLGLGAVARAVLRVGDRREEARGFARDDLRLARTVANQAAVALRHACALEQLRHDARHDHLTGLPNRTVFRELTEAAAAAAAAGCGGCVVGVLDLDGFKSVNDSLGHLAGDEVIAELGRRMERLTADGVVVGRLGGDEFALLVTAPGQAQDAVTQDAVTQETVTRAVTEEGVSELARRLLGCLDRPVTVAGESVRLGGSFGLAVAPRDGVTADDLLRNADVAMYAAKQESGGIRFYTPDLSDVSAAPVSLAGDLRIALTRGEVEVAVQPLIDLRTGAVHSVEALARWRHPVFGIVDPESFVRAADRGGVVGDLTTVVLDGALRACRGWLDAGIEVRVAVNLAARSLGDADLPADVERALAAHGVPGRLLSVELTEGGVIASPQRALAVTTRLRALGVHLAVDDFGTGYASMTYVSLLAPDQVKIDKSFVQRLGVAPRHVAIVRSIIDLARDLGVEVVAEGVTDEGTVELLRDLGCSLAQGYLFAEPMSPLDLPAWLDHWAALPSP